MKTLADGTEVSARSYYYLLDFNDITRWEYMIKHFDKNRLMDLTIDEYRELFTYATKTELEWSFNKPE